MNIKEQILGCLGSTPSRKEFAFSRSSQESRERFEKSVADFLRAKTYAEGERRCRELYFAMLDLHDKYPILTPAIERLNVEELYGTHNFACHRLHFSHQANVFLLGLFIYHNFEPLRTEIDREMRKTTVEIQTQPQYLPFRYSGVDEYGEFLYRWRLSSLCHDIGTGIQLCQGREDMLAYSLKRLNFQRPISSIKELRVFEDDNLLANLDSACGFISFSKYAQYQELHPYPDYICHDHGIMGGLIFLQLMHEAFSRHSKNLVSYNVEGMEVFWHPEILSHSIVQIGMAIAMHNLDKYPQALQSYANITTVFDIQRCPLAWLLKVADVLQEWDKPWAREEQTDQNLHTDLELIFSDSKIIVKNFPENKRNEAQEVIHNFTWPSNIISFQ